MKLFASFAVMAAAAWLGAGAAAAASGPPSPSPTASAKALGDVIVTAQRYATPIHSTPREAYVITGLELARLGAVTIGDALRLVPGVTIKDYGTPNHLETAFLRGASSTETLVLVNGRPANEPGVGLFDFSSLPVAAIDRIEIVGGAASALYGSAAMGGVINIITKDPAAHAGSAGVTFGYQGALATAVDAAAAAPDGSGARVDYSAEHARNALGYPPALGAPGGSLSNDDTNGEDVFVSLANSQASPVRVRAHFGDDASNDGEPGSVLFGASALARQQRNFERGDVSVEGKAGSNDVSVQAYADGQRIHFYDGTSDPSNFVFPYDTLAHLTTRGFGLRDTVTTPTNALTLGYDSRGDSAQFDENFDGAIASSPGTSATTGLYLSDENTSCGRLTWTAGIRDERPQGFSHTTAPSLGVMYSDPRRDEGVRFNYGRAFRIPALEEMSPLFFGNPALEPEYAATFDAGIFDGEDALTYFGARASNLIVSEPPAFVPINVSLAQIRGFDLTLAARLAGARVQVSYTDYVRADDELTGSRLPFRPTATGSIALSRMVAAWDFGTTLTYVGRRYADDPNTIQLPQYASLGAYARRAIGSSAIAVRLSNITGERVEEAPGYPVLGPTVSVTLTTAWSK